MCKNHDIYYNPIDPTTIFGPGDIKAECLTTVTINNSIEFRWYYRSNSSYAWISCYNWSENALLGVGEYHYAGFLLIAGYWPGMNYPTAYKVTVYLDGYPSFNDFFEITNGGPNSPRTCEDIDTNGRPVNMKSRFTIGVDTKICNYLSFTNIAYFNEELEDCHNFTVAWIQPNGSTYETQSFRFADYKDADITRNYWKYAFVNDSFIFINSSTPVGNWKMEIYLDDYYLNGTWISYGPVSTTPFIVGELPAADWTVMVYLDGDNSLESAAIDTFLNMASVGSSPQVNIVVQMDRIGLDSRYGNWTDCRRFYVTKGMTPTPENATLDLGEVDMGDPETLKDFVNWTMNNYPAIRYFLVLWDHGAGFVGFCFDVTSGGDALTLPKLSQALSGLPAIIDAVLIDACSTSMIEAAYQIKDYANVLIGPEDLGYEPAPYGDYLSSLTSNSTMSPNVFASEIVTDYIRWCFSISNIQNATMSATDLTQITSLSATIDDYGLLLKEKETPYHEQISLARSQTEGCQGPYAGQTGYFIDLYDFARLASQYVSDEELHGAADNLMATVGNIVIMAANKARPNCHGLSIFLPDENGKYESYEGAYEETNFAADTLWNGFIKFDLSGCALTIQTPQLHVPVTVDNESYTSDDNGEIHVFILPQYHNVSVTSSYMSGPGSRAVFFQWNDTDTSNPRTLFVNETLTLSAEYVTQYRFFMDRNFGTTDPDVGEHWYNASSSISISAAPPASTSVERFASLTWTGKGDGSYSGSDNSAIITMNEPINETATWTHEYFLTVTSPQGQGSPTPTSGWFGAGQLVIMSITTPVPGVTGTQYVCTGWNGTGSVPTSGTTSTNFTINQPSSITWNWKTQYRFVIGTDPAGIGLPSKPSSGWYDEGSLLDCVAQNISGKIFDHWTVKSLTTGQLSDYENGMSKITVTIDGPYEALAHYVSAAAWWDNLLNPENLLTVLVLAVGILTVSFLGALWIRARRRKSDKKTTGQPTTKVPKPEDFLPDRVTTGFKDLDSLLFGGLPKNYAVALTSPSCDERDMLIKRFLEAGARNGQVTFYVTVDPGSAKSLAEEFQSNFYLFICSPRADTMIESIETLPNVFKLKGVENLTEISIALTKALGTLDASLNGPRRACLGIISDVLLQHHAVQTKRWLSDLIPELRSKGFTTLAVMNPQMLPPEEVQAILELFEGEISIHEKEGLRKTVRIQKMYNQKYLDCELPLTKGK
jgi:KaiC/GvpD/RAD55 family RecA-like ATPase